MAESFLVAEVRTPVDYCAAPSGIRPDDFALRVSAWHSRRAQGSALILERVR
jgi:hypothetical protein